MNSQTTTLPVNRRVLVGLLHEDAILAAVEKVSASIKGIYRQDGLFRILLDQVFESIPAKRGVVMLAGPKAEVLEPAAFRGGEFSVSSPLPAQALRDHVGIVSGSLCAPLGDLGVIYLESARGKEFTAQHLHLLIALADEAALPAAYTAQIERVERENGIALETVSAAAEALEQAILAYSDARSKRTAAVQKWETALEETLSVVKRYDVLIALTLGDDLAATASYAVARAVPRTRGRVVVAEETPPAAPAVPVAPDVPTAVVPAA